MKSKKLTIILAILILAVIVTFFIVKCSGKKSESDTSEFHKIDSLAQIQAKAHHDSATLFIDSASVGQTKLDTFRRNPSHYDNERRLYDSLIRAKVIKNRQSTKGPD